MKNWSRFCKGRLQKKEKKKWNFPYRISTKYSVSGIQILHQLAQQNAAMHTRANFKAKEPGGVYVIMTNNRSVQLFEYPLILGKNGGQICMGNFSCSLLFIKQVFFKIALDVLFIAMQVAGCLCPAQRVV